MDTENGPPEASSAETDALLRVMEEEHDTARKILEDLTDAELAELAAHLSDLMFLVRLVRDRRNGTGVWR
jgi:hypothetical protein